MMDQMILRQTHWIFNDANLSKETFGLAYEIWPSIILKDLYYLDLDRKWNESETASKSYINFSFDETFQI